MIEIAFGNSVCGSLKAAQRFDAGKFQRPLLPAFIISCASHWQTHKVENSPLRTVLNGCLISVSEIFYDDIIRREIEIESEAFHEAVIIGRILGKYQLGISDTLVASRIDAMIQAGALEVNSEVAKDMPAYHRMLKKCTRK